MGVAETFGRVLKECRIEANLSQIELANGSDLNRSYISMLERGERQPTIGTLFQIARCLNLRPSEIIRRTEEPTKGRRRSKSILSRRL